jgi:uncharacterized membrane protein
MIPLVSAATVFVISALPIVERGALPLALHAFHLPLGLALPLVVIGNSLPAVAVIYLLDPVMAWLGRYIPAVHRFASVILVRLRRKVHPFVERFGTVGLLFFVAIPSPVTGAWTGSGAAAVLGMDKKRAAGAVALGALIANLLILAADYGFITLAH